MYVLKRIVHRVKINSTHAVEGQAAFPRARVCSQSPRVYRAWRPIKWLEVDKVPVFDTFHSTDNTTVSNYPERFENGEYLPEGFCYIVCGKCVSGTDNFQHPCPVRGHEEYVLTLLPASLRDD